MIMIAITDIVIVELFDNRPKLIKECQLKELSFQISFERANTVCIS